MRHVAVPACLWLELFLTEAVNEALSPFRRNLGRYISAISSLLTSTASSMPHAYTSLVWAKPFRCQRVRLSGIVKDIARLPSAPVRRTGRKNANSENASACVPRTSPSSLALPLPFSYAFLPKGEMSAASSSSTTLDIAAPSVATPAKDMTFMSLAANIFLLPCMPSDNSRPAMRPLKSPPKAMSPWKEKNPPSNTENVAPLPSISFTGRSRFQCQESVSKKEPP